MPGLSGPGTFESFFGNASEGDADFSGPNGAMLTRPSFFGIVKVGGPAGLEMSGDPLFCRRLFIDSSNENLTFDGVLHCNGQNADITNLSFVPSGARAGFFGGGGAGALGAIGTQSGITPAQNGGAPSGPSLGGSGGNGAVGQNSPTGAGGVVTPLPAPRPMIGSLPASSPR